MDMSDCGALGPYEATPRFKPRRKHSSCRQFQSFESSASFRPEDAHVWSGGQMWSSHTIGLASMMLSEFCISGQGLKLRGLYKEAWSFSCS